MNSKERLQAAIRLETPDRVPCAPHIAPRLVDQMTPQEWHDLLTQTDVTMTVGALGDAEIFGGAYWQRHRQVTQQGNEIITRVETPAGWLTQRTVKTTEANWRADTFFQDRADIEKVLSIPYEPPTFDLSPYWEWTEKLGDQGTIDLSMPSAFRFCLGFFGPQNLYYMIADEIDLIERLVATMNERLAGYISACCQQGIPSFWMGGTEHCGPGVVRPTCFKRLITPYDKRIVAIMHEHGATVNLHTHGKLKDILDDIAEIGVDVMSPIETGLRGDVTLAEVKARVGDRICLKGNLDDMAFLALASEAEVRAAAEDAIQQAAAGGGYILSGTDANVYHPHWVENFLVMAEIAAQHTY